MNFKIDPQILAEFPVVTLGVAGVKGIDNRGADPELGQLLRAAGFSTWRRGECHPLCWQREF